jgi:hypothetical protein
METQCCRIALQDWSGTKADSAVIGQQEKPIRVLLQPPQLPLWTTCNYYNYSSANYNHSGTCHNIH